MTDNSIQQLVSGCGLYCGSCSKYKKGKCPGCVDNEKAAWCKIRICIREKNITTCAECTEFDDVNECKKFNTIFSKFFSLVFRSDRKASLKKINEIGLDAYARDMSASSQVVIKRK